MVPVSDEQNKITDANSRKNSISDLIDSIGKILKESWQLVYGMKGLIFILGIILPLIYVFFLYFITVLVITFLIISVNIMTLSTLLLIVSLSLLFLILLYYGLFCLFTILIMLGIRRAIGLPLRVKIICIQYIREFGDTFIIFLLWLVTISSMIFLKFLIPNHQVIFFIIENIIVNYGIIFPLVYFALPLVITKRCGALEAIVEAYHIMRKNGLSFIVCFIIMGFIMAISAIPVGIGLIWTVPMAIAMMGILFRNATGLNSKPI